MEYLRREAISGSVRDPFGLRSGQFRTKIFGAKNLKFQKNLNLCSPGRRGGGPLAAVPGPAARRAPAAAATAAQFENFLKLKIFGSGNFGPKLTRTEPERTPNGSHTDPEQTPNGPPTKST